MTGALLVGVGIWWASTELLGSDETAERVLPGRQAGTRLLPAFRKEETSIWSASPAEIDAQHASFTQSNSFLCF